MAGRKPSDSKRSSLFKTTVASSTSFAEVLATYCNKPNRSHQHSQRTRLSLQKRKVRIPIVVRYIVVACTAGGVPALSFDSLHRHSFQQSSSWRSQFGGGGGSSGRRLGSARVGPGGKPAPKIPFALLAPLSCCFNGNSVVLPAFDAALALAAAGSGPSR